MMYLFATIMALLSVSGANQLSLETNFDETYCELDANIVVVIDGSASVGDTNFAKMKQFLTDFFTQMKPQASGGKLKIGLTQFADDVTVEAALTNSMTSLVSAVASMTHKKGNTNTRDAYLSGLNQLTAAGSGKDTQNFIIFLTDGKTDGGWYAAQQKMVNYTAPDVSFYQQFKNKGITVIPFGMGSDWSLDEFLTMTGNNRAQIQESSFDNMHLAINKLKTQACSTEKECVGECTGTHKTGTAGTHVVFKNTFPMAKYTIKSDKCVVAYASTKNKNPNHANTYEFTDTGTEIELYKTYDNLTAATKPDMHFSLFPCDKKAGLPKATYAATEDADCSIANATSSIEFAKAYLKPSKMSVCFENWGWTSDFCKYKHGDKLKYALSNNTLERTPLENIDPYAKCNTTECCFQVKEGFQGQSAYVFAYFDGTISPETAKASDQFDIIRCSDLGVEGKFQHHFYVDVPIDEVKALTIKVSPTYVLDTILSVTLKSFRKIVGYDTFESIRVQNRREKKDPADYYNVTVSMLVRRYALTQCDDHIEKKFISTGLAGGLDKGFPYDEPSDLLGGKKIGL